MARLEELVDQIGESGLRQELLEEVRRLKEEQTFGLVFEAHLPEVVAVPGLAPTPGAHVQLRKGDGSSFRVLSVDGSRISLEAAEGGAGIVAEAEEAFVVKRFGEPVFPGLQWLERVECADPKRASHTLLDAENYHALQFLDYVLRGQVDCIYIDPPYNTGDAQWKYNNRFVDGNDAWRHSKWLSFMEKRLVLARRLLKPDGVLIVTIDEHEVHHLGMLLEQLFPDAYRQMVTIVINPKGVTQERFSRVEEYAFFCFWGASSVAGLGDDYLSLSGVSAAKSRSVRWKGLLRSGTNARREDRANMFYPVLIDEQRGAVVGTGDPLPLPTEPDVTARVDGYAAAWPIRKDGTWGNWGVGHTSLRGLIEKGYVSVGGFDEALHVGQPVLARDGQRRVDHDHRGAPLDPRLDLI